MRNGRRQLLTLWLALIVGAAIAACDNAATTSPTASTTPTMDTFSGTWRSTTTATLAGACTSMTWSIAPTSANAASIAYSATCGTIPVTGTGTGTLNGSTFNWTTTGTAANACPFGLSGTAVQDTGTTGLRVDYSGTVCGVPVAGTQILQH